MTTATPVTVTAELTTTLELFDTLVQELRAIEAERGPMGRVHDIVHAIERRPSLSDLPRMLLHAFAGITEAQSGIRLSREALERHAIDRVRDTHVRIAEISTTTESAAMQIMDGLDRALTRVNGLSALAADGAAPLQQAIAELQTEIGDLFGLLQFQDITSQQLSGATEQLSDVEQRLQAVAHLFDQPDAASKLHAALTAPAAAVHRTYDPNATTRDTASRQEAADATFRAANAA